MKSLLVFLFFVHSMLVNASTPASGWCSKVDHYFEDIIKNEEYSIDDILDENPDVIFFGEMHNDWTSHEAFMTMMEKIIAKDADFDCVFMEMPEELDQDAMDDWLDRSISYETMNDRLCDGVKSSSAEACKQRVSLFYRPYFKRKLEKARDLGLQVYYMDATHEPYFIPGEWRNQLPKWMYEVDMVERNIIMARNIAMRLGRKHCKKAFAIVGNAHNHEITKKDVPNRGMSGYLKIFGYEGLAINFFPTKKDPREENWLTYSPFYMTEKECGLNLPTGKIYYLPTSGPNTKTSPEQLEVEKWVYDAVPSLKDRPFSTYEFVYLHDCPECSQKPISGPKQNLSSGFGRNASNKNSFLMSGARGF